MVISVTLVNVDEVLKPKLVSLTEVAKPCVSIVPDAELSETFVIVFPSLVKDLILVKLFCMENAFLHIQFILSASLKNCDLIVLKEYLRGVFTAASQ